MDQSSAGQSGRTPPRMVPDGPAPTGPDAAGRGPSPSLYAALAGLVAAVLIGAWLIDNFADSEAEKDLDRWRERLSLVADSRVREGSAWLNRHLGSIEDLALDPTVQLYASEVAAGDPAGVAAAQRSYVFSLMSAEAERIGFYQERALDPVSANITRPQRAGLAVFAADGAPLVGTRGVPKIPPSSWSPQSGSFIALGPSLEDNTPLVLFGAPIVAGEGTRGAAGGTIGWLIGARPLDGAFLETLTQPGALSRTGESYAVLRPGSDEIVSLLTPVSGGGRRLEPLADPVAAVAARTPGRVVRGTNYAGRDSLATARDYSAPVDWVLVRSVDASEALEQVNSERRALVTSLSLAGIAVLALLVLAWRFGTSARLRLAYQREKDLAQSNQQLSDFLTRIADGQPSALAAVDATLTIKFANALMGQFTGKAPDALNGARLDGFFETRAASLLRAGVAAASLNELSQSSLTLEQGRMLKHFRANFVPLPLDDKAQGTGALVVLNDITDLEEAHQRTEFTLRQLVATLTQIIDARDPWSKYHSVRVAQVATAIGGALGWDPIQIETVRIAGQLVNLGKIFVPIEILTKTDPLTDEETDLVQRSLRRSEKMISTLQFRGPVGETLAQLRARWDGKGEPAGLSGKDILPTARVLSVANAFVAMASARAHRPTLGFDKAMAILQSEAGTHYDRAAVAALNNVLENQQGREKWADFTLPVEDGDTDFSMSALEIAVLMTPQDGGTS